MADEADGLGCLVLAGLIIWGGYSLAGNYTTWMKPKNSCPATVYAQPDWASSGITYGTGKVHPMEANIASVAAECIPPEHKSDQKGYSVAITAKVNYKGTSNWFAYNSNLEERVIFECQTKNQVVLGSQESSITFVRNGTNGTVSAKITGLTAGEIERLESVVVRWKYGR